MNISITAEPGEIQVVTADTIIVSLFQNDSDLTGSVNAVNEALDGAIRELIEAGDFKGKLGDVATLYPRGAIPAKRLILVGLGERDKFDLEAIREASAVGIKQAHKLGAVKVATTTHCNGSQEIYATDSAQAVVEGSLLALYKYDAPQSKPDENETNIESLLIVESDESKLDEIEYGARVGQAIAEGVSLARTLVNRPSNVATPTAIAEAAQSMCAEVGIICSVLDEDAIRAEKMGLLLAVNQGSAESPKFIIMKHKPDQSADAGPVVLVGKGVSFDTGGYSLKPQNFMVGMKGDMSGAAAVIGTMYAVGKLNLPLHVVGLVPSVENMVSATAFKPNDVYVGSNGVTVEVINTDAEGRLILADALSYAGSLNPSAVIDVATLTGAKKIALGGRTNAVFVDDEDLYEALMAAGQRVAEPLWRMPLDPTYDAQIKSEVADIKNDGGSDAGAVTAARFLARFVGESPWAHIDIAGSQYYTSGPEQNSRSYMTSGASGTPTRTLIEYLRCRC